MNRSLRRACAALLLVVLVFATPRRAHADALTGAVVAVIAGVVVISAGITVAIVYAARHKPSITGCAGGAAGDLVMEDEHSKKTYKLTGDLAQLTTGQRVKVAGKKIGADTPKPEFRVLRVEKNLGACTAAAAQP